MNLYYIFRTMLAQKGANAIKIISVAVGLLVSCVIFTRLEYNYSYDTCFKDYDRLYQVWMTYDINGEKLGPFSSCVGKLSGGIYDELSEYVEASTNIYSRPSADLFDGDSRLELDLLASDSLFFETMGIEVLAGQPKYDLALPNVIYLSESVAKKLYGDEDAIGRTLMMDKETSITVKGIFKDVPENITLQQFNAVLSFPTFPQQINRRFRWEGADSWPTYLRLRKDVSLSSAELNKLLDDMYHQHVSDTDEVKTYVLAAPIRDTFLDMDEVKKMNLVMWVLGISLLLMTTLNYVLLTIASLSRRAKGIGVHKCSGATGLTVMGMFLGETLVILFLALLVMIALLFTFEPLIHDTINLTIPEMLSPSRIWVSCLILLFFFLVGGLLPGRLFSKIPVTQVFRRFTDKNSAWKRSLLFIQIGGVSFVSGLLATVAVQYYDILHHDLGFDYSDTVCMSIPSMKKDARRDIFLGGLRNLPYVEDVTWANSNPLWGFSGDMVYDGKDKLLFNTRIEWVGDDYVKFMKMTLLQGKLEMKPGDFVVNETFVKSMGWGDNALGRHIEKVSSDTLNVVAVIKDFSVGSLTEEIHPVVLEVSDFYNGRAFVRLKQPFDENYAKLNEYINETYPDAELYLQPMAKIHENSYQDVLMFRNAAIITAIALILISLMGLIGFTKDEVERRRKEIAVRKVNGAEASSIISLICGDIMKIAIPATIIGTLAAWYIGALWMENFRATADNIWAYYLLTALIVLLLVMACVISVTWRVANENPVDQLKAE